MVYLRDLAQGLCRDSPQTEGAQRLQKQAEDLKMEYDDVSNKVSSGRKRFFFLVEFFFHFFFEYLFLAGLCLVYSPFTFYHVLCYC